MFFFINPGFSARRASSIVTALLAVFAIAVPARSPAQAVWTNADDRDYSGNPPALFIAYWSYGYVAPDQNGNGGHAGNWSGNLVPGKGGPLDVYLGAPGDTHCNVSVTLNSLTLAPGGALSMDLYSTLTVATTKLAEDSTIALGGGTGGSYPSYTNTGTLTKTAGTGTSAFDPAITFNSTAGSTVAAASGTLQLSNGGLIDTVAFVPAAGATINFVTQDTASTAYGAHFQGTLSNGMGTGTVLFSGGTMSGTQHFIDNPQPCTLAFTGSVFQWTGGTIGSAQQGAVFNNTGVVNLSGGGDKANVSTFTNTGTMIQTGAGNFNVGNYHDGGSVTNAPGAVYDLQSDAALVTDGGSGNLFINQGLFKKSGGTGTSTLTASFSNQGGTIEVDTGTLQMLVPNNIYSNDSLSTGGTFNVAAGALLDLGDQGTFTGTYTGSGEGTVRISQGTLYTNRTTGGTFNLPGNLFQWTGGTLGGYQAGQVFTNAGTLTLSGNSDKGSYDTFTNTGTMVQTGAGNFNASDYGGGGSFTNAAGATYDLQSDASIGGSGQPSTNAGLLEKTAGSGVSSFNPDFINSGTVSVKTGTLNFTGRLDDLTGTTLTEGTWNVADGATLTFANYMGGITINQASVTLSGPNASFPAINALADNQGSFSLLELKQFTTAGDLSNENTITLDAGSTLHVAGDYTASGADAALSVVLGGNASQGVTSPGLLQVNGTTTLAGTLSLTFAPNAVLPGSADTLTILSAGSPIVGSFANVASGSRLTTADGHGSFRVIYGAGAHAVILGNFLQPGQPDVPVVTLTAQVPTVTVNSGQDAEFLLTLSGVSSSDVVVNFTIKGTAINGTDYVLLKATKKIKAGKTSKPIKIIPMGEGVGAGVKRTVVLTLQPGDGYTVGTTGKIKVKIIGE